MFNSNELSINAYYVRFNHEEKVPLSEIDPVKGTCKFGVTLRGYGIADQKKFKAQHPGGTAKAILTCTQGVGNEILNLDLLGKRKMIKCKISNNCITEVTVNKVALWDTN